MHVVILGAGTVGTSIAEVLCANQQNVCVVDASAAALNEVEERLDVQTIRGSACNAITLFQAGVLNADLCLAVTNHDEVNLVGASLARAMGARRAVSRIFNQDYLDFSTFDYQRHFGINRLLSLERLTAIELAKWVRKRGLFVVDSFARGGIEIQEVEVEPAAKIVGLKLRELQLPKEVLIGLLSRESGTIIPGGNDVIQEGDHAMLLGKPENLEKVKRLFERKPPPRLNVVIAGGGEIGLNLARILQGRRFNILLMEAEEERAHYLAEMLDGTTVLHADATRQAVMEEARVGSADVFVAATGADEDNIVCGVEARELGARRILGIVRRPDYANVLEKVGIDVAVSPREVMAQQILGMLEQGPIQSRSEIAGGDAEVWEVEVSEGAPISASPLKSLGLGQAIVAALVREGFVMVPGADDQLRPGDTAVVLVQKQSKDHVREMLVPPRH